MLRRSISVLVTRASLARVRRSRISGARLATGLVAAAGLCLLGAGPAGAATSGSGFYVRGGGFGHGIGMSQYGAGGYALHGWGYKAILEHYYSQTTLGHVSPSKIVTVLLNDGAATFRGATTIAGSKTKLTASKNYGVLVSGSKLELISDGRKVGRFSAPLEVSGSGPLDLIGIGEYRGSFVFRADGSSIQTVNALGVDDYVQGVVAAEMPASWGMAALEAQAVAARTYVLTTTVAPGDFDAYDDTRSQEYLGVAGETARTNEAVKDTSGEVVDYDGTPAVTYFFASSGGYTESIQNVWYGVTPEAWLHGVPDPYDDSYGNPYYRWSLNLSVGKAGGALGGYYSGSLKGIRILKKGVSPRIVSASVVGSKGSTTVSGAELQALLGTMSTYMSFTTIRDKGVVSAAAAKASVRANGGSGGSGGAGLGGGSGSTTSPSTVSKAGRYVEGSIYPVAKGKTVTAELDDAGVWRTVASEALPASGSYKIPVTAAGTYRVVYSGIAGPKITVK